MESLRVSRDPDMTADIKPHQPAPLNAQTTGAPDVCTTIERLKLSTEETNRAGVLHGSCVNLKGEAFEWRVEIASALRVLK